jgi:hypothetical protein
MANLEVELLRAIFAEHQNVVIRFGGFNQDHVFDRSEPALSLEVENVAIILGVVLRFFSDKFDDVSATAVSNALIQLFQRSIISKRSTERRVFNINFHLPEVR